MIIAANWKMHKTVPETEDFLKELETRREEIKGAQVVVCPPFTSLYSAGGMQKEGLFALGAQNMHWESEGAFTGEVSPQMLQDAGVRYVILGHSERRHIMGETDEVINQKMQKAFSYQFIPIFCVGETEEERDKGLTREVLMRQVKQGLESIAAANLKKVVVAYEPVWAIGTGKAASPEDAGEASRIIREAADQLAPAAGEALKVLYGGSVKQENIAGFVSLPEVQGALVGGASLQVDSFVSLVTAAREVSGN